MNLDNSQYGNVSLVGAGPGDPELLTLKALKAIENSSIIIYDNLVSKKIRCLFPTAATCIYVGKAKGRHSYKQEEINHLIAHYAITGHTVCRVKGGDSFVFGRGGEEMLFLAKQGITVKIVPGITAASGCSTYANIPLTHRGLSQACTFITAHADKTLEINWHALAQLNQTLVIYMGLTKVEQIQNQLLTAGMDTNKPVAIIENGCTDTQRTLLGQLNELNDLVKNNAVKPPALIVIGDVVTVSSQMDWLQQLQKRNCDPSSQKNLLRRA